MFCLWLANFIVPCNYNCTDLGNRHNILFLLNVYKIWLLSIKLPQSQFFFSVDAQALTFHQKASFLQIVSLGNIPLMPSRRWLTESKLNGIFESSLSIILCQGFSFSISLFFHHLFLPSFLSLFLFYFFFFFFKSYGSFAYILWFLVLCFSGISVCNSLVLFLWLF